MVVVENDANAAAAESDGGHESIPRGLERTCTKRGAGGVGTLANSFGIPPVPPVPLLARRPTCHSSTPCRRVPRRIKGSCRRTLCGSPSRSTETQVSSLGGGGAPASRLPVPAPKNFIKTRIARTGPRNYTIILYCTDVRILRNVLDTPFLAGP